MNEFHYHFRLPDAADELFVVQLDSTEPAQPERLPEWTRLEFHQCPNCPLDRTKVSHCPMAVSFVRLVEVTGKYHSHDTVTVEVATPQRRFLKTTSLQNAVGSLMGLLSATSGCPRSQFLKPMAQFHLPFSSEKETIYRAASMYLLAQYLVDKHGGKPDWDLKALHGHYDQLQLVNAAMVKRVSASSERDGPSNALVVLDSMAKLLQFSIDEALADMWPVFESYRSELEQS
ncbi:hypothetical protein HPT27_17575 [Permianibacter sp. IMCC34836]|uniref:DUF6901 family protein n=1 Tax=Permianibacter fluminis TaxID=2738515 RepID=UPI0015522BD4|nr:hypothetical protein [Permianibacter fluminis]NQD38830.1 hypothetical protein [Permianibacter fluminis]